MKNVYLCSEDQQAINELNVSKKSDDIVKTLEYLGIKKNICITKNDQYLCFGYDNNSYRLKVLMNGNLLIKKQNQNNNDNYEYITCIKNDKVVIVDEKRSINFKNGANLNIYKSIDSEHNVYEYLENDKEYRATTSKDASDNFDNNTIKSIKKTIRKNKSLSCYDFCMLFSNDELYYYNIDEMKNKQLINSIASKRMNKELYVI